MTTETARSRPASFGFLIAVMIFLMAATFAYMTYVIKAVPKTAANSKAGLFAEVVEQLLLVPQEEAQLGSAGEVAEAIAAMNQRLQHVQGGVQLKGTGEWSLQSWRESLVHGRPLLTALLKTQGGQELVLGFFPLAKRHFPKTGGFAYRDAWFFVFGRDHDVAQVPAHQKEVELLKSMGLNLVATNYGNDFFIMMLSDMDSAEMSHKFFELTTIYEQPPSRVMP